MKQALITGGARGIGLGIAEAMLAAGYAVTVTGLTAEEIATVPARDHLVAVQLDVTSDAEVAACIRKFKQLDALINCAGIVLRDGKEFTIEGFQKVIDVNLTGTMRMCLAAQPLLEQSGGAIVNTASVWSFFGGGLVPGYTASKGGVAQLTKALAVAWAPTIRVNAIGAGLGGNGADSGRPRRRRAFAGHYRPHAAGPLGQATGYRRRGGVPVLGGRRIHHRHGAAGGWRLYRQIAPPHFHPRPRQRSLRAQQRRFSWPHAATMPARKTNAAVTRTPARRPPPLLLPPRNVPRSSRAAPRRPDNTGRRWTIPAFPIGIPSPRSHRPNW
jgi:NAD(P)-dependent dehydrogenase (short-subunit alcohol dehydrogenase family)